MAFWRQPTVEQLQWLNALKEGDFVDALKIEEILNKICWSRATIMGISEDYLQITFINEKDSKFNR